MTKEQMVRIKKDRIAQLESNGKNLKSSGVIRKIKREIRKIEN